MSGNLRECHTGTPVSASAFGQNTAASTGTSAFASTKPATGSNLFGGGSSAFGGNGGGSDGTSAAGLSSGYPFRSDASNTGNASSGRFPSGQAGSATAFGALSGDANPPPVRTGTSTPAYSVFREKDPSDPSTILQYISITAAPAYKGMSLEELRVQDYQQNRKPAVQAPYIDPAMQSPDLFGLLFTPQQRAAGSISGDCTTGMLGATTSQLPMVPFGVIGQQQPSTGTVTPLWRAKPTTGFGSTFGQPTGHIFDPGKLACVEELLIKSLLGEDLVDTQFHLFSARSPTLGRVMKPRVLCASNALLAKRSEYFLDLLSSDIVNPSDPSLVDLTGDNDIPSDARVDDYGYASDSDLDDCDDSIPAANPEAPKNHSAASSTSTSEVNTKTQHEDCTESSEDGSCSVSSDTMAMIPKQPRMDESFTETYKDGAISVMSSQTAIQGTPGNKGLWNQTAMRLRSLGSRHILVQDTAFQTWFTLLNYLYTGKFSFLPLSSTMPEGHPKSLSSSADGPRCSAKSMYRLASKVGLDSLRDEAFGHIRSNLTEHNILDELSRGFVSKYPQLLEMELDVLYSHIGSPPVVAGFTTLAQRVANKELPHGADIMVGIYARLLKAHHPFALKPGGPTSLCSFMPLKPVGPAVGTSDAPASGAGAKPEAGPSHADKQGTRLESPPPASESTSNVLLHTSASVAVPAATSTREPNVGGKKTVRKKRK